MTDETWQNGEIARAEEQLRLAEASGTAQTAMADAPEGSADWAEYASTLSVCLWDRYDATGSLADLNRATGLGDSALAALRDRGQGRRTVPPGPARGAPPSETPGADAGMGLVPPQALFAALREVRRRSRPDPRGHQQQRSRHREQPGRQGDAQRMQPALTSYGSMGL